MIASEYREALREKQPHVLKQPVLTLEDLTVAYNAEPAIEGVSFTIHASERVAVIGPNGAGKSTLMKVIMGLLQARTGGVDLHGRDRQSLGYVAQHEAVNWDFPVTVRDVVMMGRARQIGWLCWPRRVDWQAVDAALARVGMSEFAQRQIGELSGGQRRRVFVARALAQDVDILLLDEPFSGVDASAQVEMMVVLDTLHEQGITIILSTHDLNLAFQRFDRVMALNHRIVAYGTPREVYTPQILSQLYGGKLATWDQGRQVMVFVDDHNCC